MLICRIKQWHHDSDNFQIFEEGANKNSSARTTENIRRHLTEETYIWYRLIKDMDNDLFKRAFGNNMIDKEASSQDEILCEKMFILLNPRMSGLKQAGIIFMYDICANPDVMVLLEKKYNWTKTDMAQITGELLD